MPLVTVCVMPSGFPIASTSCPTRTCEESPSTATVSFPFGFTFTTARSSGAEVPTTCAGRGLPSENITCTCRARSTTWWLVMITHRCETRTLTFRSRRNHRLQSLHQRQRTRLRRPCPDRNSPNQPLPFDQDSSGPLRGPAVHVHLPFGPAHSPTDHRRLLPILPQPRGSYPFVVGSKGRTSASHIQQDRNRVHRQVCSRGDHRIWGCTSVCRSQGHHRFDLGENYDQGH